MVVNELSISFVLSVESCIIVNLVPEECWHLNGFTVNFTSKRLNSLFCKYNVCLYFNVLSFICLFSPMS